jgi:hypothetical protein
MNGADTPDMTETVLGEVECTTCLPHCRQGCGDPSMDRQATRGSFGALPVTPFLVPNLSFAAARALEQLNHSPLNGKPLRVMWSHRDPSIRKSNIGNIFIKVG